jgi:hypothetical protein
MVYLLIIIISLLVLVQLMLRTNTAVVFMAVGAGTILLNATGTDTDLLARSISSGMTVSSNMVQAAVLLLPAVVSAIVLRKRVSKSKILFTVVPAFCAAIIALTLVYPFLSPGLQSNLANSEGWTLIAQYYQFIVVLGILSSLITVTVTIPKAHKTGTTKKGKH